MAVTQAPKRARFDRAGGAGAMATAQEDPCCAPVCEPPLSAAEAARHAQVLKALADPQRLRLLSLIAAQPKDESLCVCDMETGFDLTQGTISHNLRVLREAGLVTVSKQGLWHYYALAPEGLAPVKMLLDGFGE